MSDPTKMAEFCDNCDEVQSLVSQMQDKSIRIAELEAERDMAQATARVLAAEFNLCPTGMTTDKCINLTFPHDSKLCVECRTKWAQAKAEVKSD